MGEKISIGDYGEMSFFLEVPNRCYKKDKKGDPILYIGHRGRFLVIDVDRKMILVRDHDEQELVVPRTNIRYFEPQEKPEAMLRDEKLLQTIKL